MKNKTLSILFLLFSYLLITRYSTAQTVVINEVSNGPSGSSKEYVEFIVTGPVSCDTPPDTIDIRHWIFDDNNGYFASGSGTGIAKGACRFSDDDLWAKIPVGTIILIYNDNDKNDDIPDDDLSMTDGNCRLVIPISSNLFERHENQPSTSNSDYATSGWLSGGDWTEVSMKNSDDSYQIRDVNDISIPSHSVSYGNNNNNTIIYFNQSGSTSVFYFDNTNSDDPFAQDNWIAGGASANNNDNGNYENGNNDQTPDYPNSINNENWIISLNHGCTLPPSVDAGLDQTICGNSTTITATGGSSSAVYTWNNGLGTGASQTVSPTTNTEYIVTMTDNGWCVSDTVEIFVTNITFTLSSNDPSSCNTDDGNITISELDPNTEYQISYDDGDSQGPFNMTTDDDGDIIIDNLGAGTYTDFTVSLDDCSSTNDTTINLTEPDAPSVDAGSDQTVCEGSSVTLTATNPDDADITWDNNVTDGQSFVPPVGTTTYTVTASLNGCTSTDHVDVTVNPNPTPNISGSLSFCDGSSTTLDAGNGYSSYQWNPNGESTQTITVSSAGTYSVTVTDDNGCSGSDQVDVTVNPNPTPDISGSSSFCDGSSTTLDAGDGYSSYQWNPNGESTQTITVSSAGTYSVTVIDDNGCSGSDHVDVSESSNLSPHITGNLSFCDGSSTTLDAGDGYSSYQWNPNGESTQTITVSSAGTYSVTVTDDNCCSGSDHVDVNIDTVNVYINGHNTICTG